MKDSEAICIWCWDHDDIDSGHTAIQANCKIWGFYPTGPVGDLDAPIASQAEFRDEAEHIIADYYVLLYFGRPDLHLLSNKLTVHKTTGLLESDVLITPRVAVYCIKTEIDKYQNALGVLNDIKNEPGLYHLKTNNCVNTTIRVLVDSGILKEEDLDSVNRRPAPSLMIKKLDQLVGSYPKSAIHKSMKGIGWFDNNYHWIDLND